MSAPHFRDPQNREFVQTSLKRARALLDLGRNRAAEKEVRLALAKEPNHWEALQLLGLCLLRQSAGKEAEDALQSAVAAAPTEPHAHYLLAYLRREAGRTKEAESGYREALRLSPEEPVYLRALAELLAGQKRFEEALALARQAVAVAPERASNHVTLGFVASSSGDRVLARTCYEEALRLDPNDSVAWNNLGCVDLAQGKPMAARARFHEALRLNPEGSLAKDNLKLVAPKERPPEIYAKYEAFERHLLLEVCEGVLLKGGGRPEGHLLCLMLATKGRAIPLIVRRAPQVFLLLSVSSATMVRLVRAGPLGLAAVIGSSAFAYLLSHKRLAELRMFYEEQLRFCEAEFGRLRQRWLSGALSRRERDRAMDALLDGFCRQVEITIKEQGGKVAPKEP